MYTVYPLHNTCSFVSFGLQYVRTLFSIHHSTVQYCTVLYCTVLYYTVLYTKTSWNTHVCFILYSPVQYCTVLYCTVLYCRPKRREITCFSHTVQNITIIQGSHYFILAHFRSYCILYVYPYIDSFRRNIGFLINISYVLINSNFTCLSHFEKKLISNVYYTFSHNSWANSTIFNDISHIALTLHVSIVILS